MEKPTRRLITTLAATAIFLAGCAPAPPQLSAFRHEIGGTAHPWNSEAFPDITGRVTFALFSDLTGGERPGVFAAATKQLNLLRPELVLNVGDLIEGETTDLAVLNAEWDSFDQRAGAIHAPVFRTGGNHDLSGPVSWDTWNDRHGPRHYHFVYRDILFLVLDTEDNPRQRQQELEQIREDSMAIIREKGWGALPETGYGQLEERVSGRIGAAQADAMIKAIETHDDVRWTFVVMHKPAWKRPGEENFSRIEAALQDRDYTVFNGHEHFYHLERRHGRDYIQLGTTGGFQPPGQPLAVDHLTLVTVTGNEVDIANLRLSGIFDRSGQNPYDAIAPEPAP